MSGENRNYLSGSTLRYDLDLDLDFQFQFLIFIFMKDYMNGTTSNAQILSSNEADQLLCWN